MPTKEDLRYFQAMPLEVKIGLTQNRIREWVRQYGVSGVYVSFSGGKDSTVLLHIVRKMFPDVEAVFVNTGLEFPEIQKFVKTFDNVTILRPAMRFDEVIKKYGYPLISKSVAGSIETYNTKVRLGKPTDCARVAQLMGTYQMTDSDGNKRKSKFDKSKYKPLLEMDFLISDRCCSVMKKAPLKTYERKTKKLPIVATMASESMQREAAWLKTGCNAFDSKRPISQPMSFWTEQDVLQYIKQYNIPIAPVYGDVVYADDPDQLRIDDCGGKLTTTGCSRTGCIFCAFGCHLEKEPSRFQRLKETHPRQYEYCIGGGEYVDGVWQPNKDGLGMGHVFDELNKIYGDGFIKY